MIDEELYQLAADELNSDRRKPHIWARACALASDDHDEARYLYTNLRVEELISEREAGVGDTRESVRQSHAADTEALELEPIDFSESSGLTDADADEISSTRPGLDAALERAGLDELITQLPKSDESPGSPGGVDYAGPGPDALGIEPLTQAANLDVGQDAGAPGNLNAPGVPGATDEGTLRPYSVRGASKLDLDDADKPDFDADAVERMNDEDGAPLSAIHGQPLDETRDDEGDARRENVDATLAQAAAFSALRGDSKSGARDNASADAADSTATDALFEADDSSAATDAFLDANDGDTTDAFRDAADGATTDSFRDADDNALSEIFPEPNDDVPGDPDTSGDQIAANSSLDDVPADDVPTLQAEVDQAFADTDSGGTPDHPSTDAELEWLDDEIRSDRNAITVQRREASVAADELTQELERQADHLPGVHSDVVAHEDGTLIAAAGVAAGGAAAVGALAGNAQTETSADQPGSPVRQDYAEPQSFDEGDGYPPSDGPLDLTHETKGTPFAVYHRADGRLSAVKEGVSWPALFFTLPWLLYRQLFGTAIVYALLWLVLVGGLLMTGLAWMDAGSSATLGLKVVTVGFALLALIGLLYLPFRYGNDWRADKLESRGYELTAWVRAHNAGNAQITARRAASLD